MYYRNSRIDISEPLQRSLVLVHAIFLFHFSSLIFLLDFYPSFSRARFRLLLLERPANHRCDPFEFSSLKLLYTFSCSKVLDSLRRSQPLPRMPLLAMLRRFSTSFLPSMLLFRDSNYEPRAYPFPTPLNSLKSNRSVRNSQVTSSLNPFSFRYRCIAFQLIKSEIR